MGLVKAALRWMKNAPAVVLRAREDIEAVRKSDPAARSAVEVALLYPGVHALWLHRVAHDLWTHGSSFSARAVGHANRFITGIEIHPGATIGRRVFIDHGMGVVIGETATVGDDCILYKGVVLGGVSLNRVKRHPQLAPGVVVGSNACILGAIEIGEGARIGSGSVVVRPVPAGATVVGVPARVIVPAKHRFDASLDHANLPDPVLDMVRALVAQNEKLRHRVARLEQKLDVDHDEEQEFLPFDGEELPPADGG
ncbi:Serine acetyltransferase [Labilithrix luteola]|uniref:Serine acetyltransferase n=1 Tax=Labilithrix luteola TaxID=1391654 RepID=A0A0K1QG93_9BACT|nr:serine O-acetyltransferase [Labilithrix luteola]AKV04687.1 Serine acetyltransferase [Labilithrix luteola]